MSHCAFDRVRLYPTTVCPLLSRRFTIRPPITPRPTNPRFAIGIDPKITGWFSTVRDAPRWPWNPRGPAASEPALPPAPFTDCDAQPLAECVRGGTNPGSARLLPEKSASAVLATTPRPNRVKTG